MTVRFILGRAGTGKTKYCIDNFLREIRKAPLGPSLILLVPEQATFQMEQSLLHGGLEGMLRGHVLSFRRLAHRVLEETGGGKRLVNDTGKKLILSSVILDKKGELQAFGRSSGSAGFVDNLAASFSELHAYSIPPAELLRRKRALEIESGRTALTLKMEDIYTLYASFESSLEGLHTDPDDCLTLAAQNLCDCSLFHGARVWVDGFSGFTPQEENMLAQLMQVVERIEITLCMDSTTAPEELGPGELFYRSGETYEQLLALAGEQGTAAVPPLCLDQPGEPPKRFGNSPELAHLEMELFSGCSRKFEGSTDNIKVISAPNMTLEVDAAAREIIRLCRDEGLRWREISVILRHLEPYEEILQAVFAEYEIPYFIDKKEIVYYHPLTELIASALEAVLSGWDRSAVLRLLKSDLIPVDRDEVDALEMITSGLGSSSKEAWVDAVKRLNTESCVQEQNDPFSLAGVIQVLARLDNALKMPATVKDMAAALFSSIRELHIEKSLQQWRSSDIQRGYLNKAQEYVQVWNAVLDLLDQMAAHMGERIMTGADFAALVGVNLSSLRIGLIPPGLDQVLITSVERSRHPKVQASFILGANEGIFPSKTSEDVIFSDQEREVLRKNSLELAPTSRERLGQETYLAYIAMTRPSGRLWVSYSLSGQDGRPLAPSPLISRIRKMFPNAVHLDLSQRYSDGYEAVDLICSPRQVLDVLVHKLAENRGELSLPWRECFAWFKNNPHRWEKSNAVFKGLCFKNEEKKIPQDLAENLFGTQIRGSVSSLEQMAKCPFAHFLERGLKLSAAEEFVFTPAHRGTFFHDALQNFASEMDDNGMEWGRLDPDFIKCTVDKITAELVPRIGNRVLESSPGMIYKAGQLKKTLKKAVEILNEQGAKGCFKQVLAEVPFGLAEGTGPLEIEIERGRKLALRGRIDRIDAAEVGGQTYVRVIDYKSGGKDFRLGRLYHGLSLQLLAYLAVAVKDSKELLGRSARPAGALYFFVGSPTTRVGSPLSEQKAEETLRKRLKMNGLLVDDMKLLRSMDAVSQGFSDIIPVEFTQKGLGKRSSVVSNEWLQRLMRFTLQKMTELGRRVAEGDVSIAPYRDRKGNACEEMACIYKPVCCFDLNMGNSFINLSDCSDAVFKEKILIEMGERIER